MKKPQEKLLAAADVSSSPSDVRERRRPPPRPPVAKIGAQQAAPDADAVMAKARLLSLENWRRDILDLRDAAEAGKVPPPFAALGAIRLVMDALLHRNQVLNGTWGLPLPAGGSLVGYAKPPAIDAPDPDPIAGRHPNDLVPIPLWAVMYLAEVHTNATRGLAASEPVEQREAAAVNLNHLFGVTKKGRGNQGILHLSLTIITARKMATSVWALVNEHGRSAEAAFEIVANLFCRAPRTVREAWQEHRGWVERVKAAEAMAVPKASNL